MICFEEFFICNALIVTNGAYGTYYFIHRHVFWKMTNLWHETHHVAFTRMSVYHLSFDGYRSCIRNHHIEHTLYQCSLTTAVGPYKYYARTFVYLQVDIVQHVQMSEFLADMIKFYHRIICFIEGCSSTKSDGVIDGIIISAKSNRFVT